MSVRKRTWKNPKGETKKVWVVRYVDQRSKRGPQAQIDWPQSFDPIFDPTEQNRS
jgi:hypothetical protein